MNGCIYLDNAATTWPKPECVYEAFDAANRNYAANAGRGSYRMSKQASDIIEDVRTMMARLLGCTSPRQVVFTPSATIALNEIIYGVTWNEHSVAYVSPYEHNAAMRPLRIACDRYGAQTVVMPCAPDGSIDLERLSTMFAQKAPNYVFVSHVSNVTGYILPVREIAALAHRHDAMVVVDAAQSAGIFPVDLLTMGADFIAFAGHKGLYASFGVGGFAGRDLSRLTPVIAGGTGSDSLNTSCLGTSR
jgi:selenocysteine lyase/cysteine desulfurase